jgi:predicted DNA-binding antitoxin AbrB/MazE fold protein
MHVDESGYISLRHRGHIRGGVVMSFSVEATYEDGVLKPARPLPLHEHEKVQLTIHPAENRPARDEGVIPCRDEQLIEWAARDPELDFPPPRED